MRPNLYIRPSVLALALASLLSVFSGCQSFEADKQDQDHFFTRQNELNNGDYLATFPYHNADSCIIKLEAEVPESLRLQTCLALWYRTPRIPVANAFRFLELYDQHFPHDTVRAFTQTMRAEFYVEMAAFDSAALCLREADEIYTRLNRPLNIADIQLLHGRIAMYRNNFSTALDRYYEALSALNNQDTSFSEMHAIVYYDISNAFERSGQPEKSREWLTKIWTANMSKIDKPWFRRGIAAGNMAMTYLSTRPDSSVYWANKAQEIFQQSPSGNVPNRVFYILGRACTETKDYAKAHEYLLKAYRNRPDDKEVFGYYQFPLALGKVYLERMQLDSAMYCLEEAKLTPDTGNLAKTYELMGEVYAKQRLFEKAWQAEKENFRLNKLKLNSEKIIAAADAEARYQSIQKAQRIRELEAQQAIARQKIFIILLVGLLLSGILFFLYQRQRLQRRWLEEKKIVLEQEKQLLEQAKILAETNEQLKTQELIIIQKNLTEVQIQLNEANDILSLKNQMIEALNMRITSTPLPGQTDGNMETNSKLTNLKILTPKDWIFFQKRFDEQLPGIISNLKQQFPDLTSAETRLFLLMKLGFESQEISEILGISRESVWRSRHRLAKKLNLTDTGTLDVFVTDFLPKY